MNPGAPTFSRVACRHNSAPKQFTPRMRTYVSITLTNGRSHTMTTSAVVSAYHLTITRLWRAPLVEEGRPQDVVNEMVCCA